MRGTKAQSGQASLMIAMMIMTFMLLFQFVVNVGLLVNAKINLQNAADLAAYAGASTQARQLNQIAYLNYEMRRQYKKFLFRYYVIGNMAQKQFPGSGQRYLWSPDGTKNYGVPAVCVIYNGKDNNCQLSDLPPLPTVNANPFDAIATALKNQLANLETIRKANCARIGLLNRDLLTYWLYNTDPQLDVLRTALANAQTAGQKDEYYIKSLKTLEGLAFGLGLVPREILTHQRIKTLESYVNAPPQIGMTFDDAQKFKTDPDPSYRERSIQAFLSAYNTLGGGDGGGHTFDDSSSITLDELLPGGEDGAQMIKLNTGRVGFDAYFVDYPRGGDGSCNGTPNIIRVSDLPVGVYKDPKILTYYSIRLKAKARLLFSPFGDIELKAYAAAQPFGSRIGPPIKEDGSDYVQLGVRAANLTNCGVGECVGVPNLPVLEEDNIGIGWNNPAVLSGMFNSFKVEGGQVKQVLGPEDMETAYQAVMAPNPWEKAKYTIPHDIGAIPEDPTHDQTGDPFQKLFDENLVMSFWAPIVSPQNRGDSPDEIIAELLKQNVKDTNVQDALGQGIKSYMEKLNAGTGENGESLNIARLSNPMKIKRKGAEPVPAAAMVGSQVVLNYEAVLQNSWNGVHRKDYQDRGRLGYSVKFVSFDTLMRKQGVTTDGTEAWTNVVRSDAESEADLPFIKH